jgi:uncharacterized membrane protein YgcG
MSKRLLVTLVTLVGTSLLAAAVAADPLVEMPPGASSGGGLAVPALTSRVVDLADMIPSNDELELGRQSAELEKETGAQLAILTVPTLAGEKLEDFSLRVAKTWELGQKGIDNGILILLARDERRIRIEIGLGLEKTIPNALAKRVIDEIMTPRFKDRDIAGGLAAAITCFGDLIEGKPLAQNKSNWRSHFFVGAVLGFVALLVWILRKLNSYQEGSRSFSEWEEELRLRAGHMASRNAQVDTQSVTLDPLRAPSRQTQSSKDRWSYWPGYLAAERLLSKSSAKSRPPRASWPGVADAPEDSNSGGGSGGGFRGGGASGSW